MDEWNVFPSEPSVPQPEPTVNEPVAEPSAPPAEPQPTWQEPEQPVTPPVYDPYGWNTQPAYQRPVKKKANGAKVAVAVIGTLCAVTIVVLSVLLALAWGDGSWWQIPENPDTPPAGTNTNAPTVTITELEEDAQGLTTTEIVDRNINSTVLLTMYSNSTAGGFPFGQSSADQEVEAGSASGIVMSADGYIITNWHCVVNESTGKEFPRIDVEMYDGTVYEYAEIIGYDSATDLAVIKVEATDLQPAEFGDSTQLKMGNKVVALGNSGGLGWSTTQGIVSGLARDVYEDTGYSIKCIQIDAAINPGNSGGPLFNAAGQVIAVNSAKIVAEGYEGIGFAIPINEAKVIIDSILKNGYVTGRVSLGITGQTYADSYYQGFLIATIEDGSALENTEAREGDLIIGVDNVTVRNYAQLRSELAKHKVGDTVTLKLLRSTNRQVREFTVTVRLNEAKQ